MKNTNKYEEVVMKEGYYLSVKEINTDFDTGNKWVTTKILRFDDASDRAKEYENYMSRIDGETDYRINGFEIIKED